MEFRANRSLRNLGIYKLRDKTLIALKQSEELAFLFSEQHWNLHGPVDYRVSHGGIYRRGVATGLLDEDLIDTGKTASAPTLSLLLNRKGY